MWVAGEVQRPRLASRGHLYFELVEKGDRDEIVGRIDAVLFRRDLALARRRLHAAGEEIVEGQTLRCGGEVDLYVQAGRLQLVVREVDPLFTVGVVAQRRRQTLAALQAAGDLDRNRRLELPPVPLHIGLVTSRESAAYHDFVSTLGESGYGFTVRLVHASVQGATAAAELVRALATLARLEGAPRLDAVVLIRGGGARSDFHCFDDPRLAETIARYRLPVLTGLGHEIDESIADLVAHSALKTPTRAAEHLVARVVKSERALVELHRRLSSRAERILADSVAGLRRAETTLVLGRHRLAAARQRLAALAGRIGRAARGRLGQAARRYRHASEGLTRPPQRLLGAARRERALVAERLDGAARRWLRRESERVGAYARLCHQLAPQRLLERGFSVTRTLDGGVVREAAAAPPGTKVRTQLASGSLQSRVEQSE